MQWQFKASILLLVLSACLYGGQILIFDNPRDTFFYLVQDMAFIPIQVILVTLVINGLLAEREKRAMLSKLNMVIGVFYSTLGTELLAVSFKFDSKQEETSRLLAVKGNWTAGQFAQTAQAVQRQTFHINVEADGLAEMKDFLLGQRDFLTRLLENQNLLEHGNFTDLLWAVFHLADELAHRDRLTGLPKQDYQHLAGDVERAYRLLILEWLAYMMHLKEDYPYLFSLAIRMNPFQADRSAIIGH